MKVRVTFKTPDALDDAIREVLDIPQPVFVDPDEWRLTTYHLQENAKRKCARWVRHGECITVEFDLDNNTCIVVEN